MRFLLTILMAATMTIGALTACQNAAPPIAVEQAKANAAPRTAAPESADEAPRISLADAKKDFDAGNAIFVDTRAEVSYKQEHIKGAINLPAEAAATRYKEIPTGKKIIAYCS